MKNISVPRIIERANKGGALGLTIDQGSGWIPRTWANIFHSENRALARECRNTNTISSAKLNYIERFFQDEKGAVTIYMEDKDPPLQRKHCNALQEW